MLFVVYEKKSWLKIYGCALFENRNKYEKKYYPSYLLILHIVKQDIISEIGKGIYLLSNDGSTMSTSAMYIVHVMRNEIVKTSLMVFVQIHFAINYEKCVKNTM